MGKNVNIKKAYTQTEFTPEQVEEVKRCMYGYDNPETGKFESGPIYFAKNYVRIQHPKRGDIPFILYEYQERMMNMFLQNNKVIVLSARQTGKEQPHYSKIATPDGWTTMGDIHPGDVILTPDGCNSKVLQKHPQGVKDVYRIHCDDGSFADCGIDHLWKCHIRDKWDPKAANGHGGMVVQEQIRTTRELIEYFNENKSRIDSEGYSITIPTVERTNFSRLELPIHPYTLGTLLSDSDTEIDRNIASGLGLTELRVDTKFIPIEYLRSSHEQRLSLLQGIMDTGDVSVQEGGKSVLYTTKSCRLRDDIQQLVWSLGGKCPTTSHEDNYNLTISLPTPRDVFRIESNRDQCQDVRDDELRRTIVDIVNIGQEESSCITIDHPDHLYITDNFTVTHNSVTSSVFLLWFAIFNPNVTVLIAANRNANAMEMIARIGYAYEYLPMWMKPGVTEDGWNKHTLKFDNKSRIVSDATSVNTGRGMSISLLYLDEFAFVAPNVQEEFWTSILPTLSTGGACIMTSTPNGSVDKFSSLWRASNLESNMDGLTFKPIHVKWDEPPGRDENFKQSNIALLGEIKWKQEYECCAGDTKLTLMDEDGNIIEKSMSELYNELQSA